MSTSNAQCRELQDVFAKSNRPSTYFNPEHNCIEPTRGEPENSRQGSQQSHETMVVPIVINDALDINMPDSAGITPLHHAIINGHIDTVRDLVIEFNADIT